MERNNGKNRIDNKITLSTNNMEQKMYAWAVIDDDGIVYAAFPIETRPIPLAVYKTRSEARFDSETTGDTKVVKIEVKVIR